MGLWSSGHRAKRSVPLEKYSIRTRKKLLRSCSSCHTGLPQRIDLPRVFQHDRNVAKREMVAIPVWAFSTRPSQTDPLFLFYAPLSTVYNDVPLEATPGICTPCYGSKTGHGVLCELRHMHEL